MIRTVLIDDEADSIRILQKLLVNYCPAVDIIGTAEGVDTAAELIRSTRPALVFLDIEMTHGNAFDLLNRLQPLSFHVIFVTAFDNHAVRAFKYSVVDYLLKPVNIDELCAAVEKVSGQVEEQSMLGRVQTLLDNMSGIHLEEQKMAIPTLNGFSFIALRDIIRMEAKGSCTKVCLAGKQEMITTRTIKEYENLLPPVFFCRVHNSHIINLRRIQKYQRGRGGFVIMEDGSNIEIASRRRDEFLKRLLK
jgi:two-component system LytT family response regulator